MLNAKSEKHPQFCNNLFQSYLKVKLKLNIINYHYIRNMQRNVATSEHSTTLLWSQVETANRDSTSPAIQPVPLCVTIRIIGSLGRIASPALQMGLFHPPFPCVKVDLTIGVRSRRGRGPVAPPPIFRDLVPIAWQNS